MKKLKRKELVELTACTIGEVLHTGLRKWCEDPQSSIAWNAISKMSEEQWHNLLTITAKEVLNNLGRRRLLKP